MTDLASAPMRPVRLWKPDVTIDRRPDGVIYVRSPDALAPYPATLGSCLEHWARVAPERTLVARREAGGDWRRISFGEAWAAARSIGEALLARGLSAERPLVILSGNDLEHALMGLGALVAGIPYSPVSPPYSLVSSDFAKLRTIIDLLTPGLVFASSGRQFAKAIAATVPAGVEVAVTDAPATDRAMTSFAELAATVPTARIDQAAAKVTTDSIAKILFTSGSTGIPKGVIVTHQGWSSNLRVQGSVFPFLDDEPPVMVDWLPWNHTFGGNNNFGTALFFGGTLYIDDGRPVPGKFEETVRNLREIAPTIYLNVPKGYEMLVQYMRDDRRLRETFFSRLRSNFFAGAALAQHVWDGLDEQAVRTCGERIIMMSGLGATETGPSATFCNPQETRAGAIGLPVPGATLKLVPNQGKLEFRVKGPSVTPGYWRQPESTAAAFDDEGFYRMGDAVRFVDEANPKRGFVFDGRVTEDFKLATGTWVSVGPLRARLIAALAPFVRDVVVAGHQRDDVRVMIVPDSDACRAEFAPAGQQMPDAELYALAALRAMLTDRLAAWNQIAGGSSMRVAAAAIVYEPLSLDVGEVTDKGSINQRAVLTARQGIVDDLYSEQPSARVLTV